MLAKKIAMTAVSHALGTDATNTDVKPEKTVKFETPPTQSSAKPSASEFYTSVLSGGRK